MASQHRDDDVNTKANEAIILRKNERDVMMVASSNAFTSSEEQYQRMFEPLQELQGVVGWCALDKDGLCLHAAGELNSFTKGQRHESLVQVMINNYMAIITVFFWHQGFQRCCLLGDFLLCGFPLFLFDGVTVSMCEFPGQC